jgi:hypothetical protein
MVSFIPHDPNAGNPDDPRRKILFVTKLEAKKHKKNTTHHTCIL